MRTLTIAMVIVGLFTMSSVMSGCAAKRTRGTDPVLRIAIDPDSISAGSYARLQRALIKSGYFVVAERGSGLNSVLKEQNLQHKKKTARRFDQHERFALLSKLYGIGGIVIADSQCEIKYRITNSQYFSCLLNLTLVNTSTGEVMSTGEEKEDTEYATMAPKWDDVVADLIDNYPKKFIDKNNPNLNEDRDEILLNYRATASANHAENRDAVDQDDEE